ncbi:MAG: ferritin [Marinilabiliaceae bacterium]|jgi:ferritin|nr:ferritin [Marinilabiliaceae bacterium]
MLKKSIEDICNRQVEREFYSSLLYLAMASWTETKGYAGIADWLYEQAEEEKLHMLKFVRYINERGGHAIMPALEKPPVDFGDINTMFDEVLKHEQYISESINEVAAMAIEENDFATTNWIQWFISEQVEEESSVQAIIDKLNLVGSHNMYMFDRDIMGMRAEEAASE